MGPLELISIFFAVAALQPTLRQRFLEASRQRLIASIEKVEERRA